MVYIYSKNKHKLCICFISYRKLSERIFLYLGALFVKRKNSLSSLIKINLIILIVTYFLLFKAQ